MSRFGCRSHSASERGLLRAAGAFSLLIAADGFFLLRDRILPRMLGVPELLTYAIYGILVLLITVAFRQAVVEDSLKFSGLLL